MIRVRVWFSVSVTVGFSVRVCVKVGFVLGYG